MTRPHLIIDPGIQFGRPCVPGTRVPAAALAGLVAAGENVDQTADDYDVTRQDVLLACWWAADVALLLPKSRRDQFRQRLVDAWRDWHHQASGVFGGWEPGPLTDPPKVQR